jgi:hypothetical protein
MANLNATGLHWIDGKDLWTVFGIFVESGSDDFLKVPPRKPSIEHDWMDTDGKDVDLSRIFFQDRDITLKCALVATNEADFWAKRAAFIAELRQPGTKRFEVNEFENQSFFVYYKEMTGLTRFTRIRDLDGVTPLVACKFTIVLTENLPADASIGNSNVYIVDEDGRFLIT